MLKDTIMSALMGRRLLFGNAILIRNPKSIGMISMNTRYVLRGSILHALKIR